MKKLARWLMNRVPFLDSPARRLWFAFWKARVKRRGRRDLGGLVDPHRMLTVNVKDIRFGCRWEQDEHGRSLYEKFEDRGKILGGDWDTNTIPFEEFDVYRGLVGRFLQGKTWEETDYYHRVLGQVLGGFHKRGMTTKEDVDARMRDIDLIFEKIKGEGYKPLSDLDPGDRRVYPGDEDEVTIRIGRHGALLFEDGRHRLSIAKILGVDKIPVKVTVRHQRWFDFVREVWAYAEENDGKIYNIISHPDLDSVPARHGWDRFHMIKNSLPQQSGTMLDIGAHWGFYCHQFEALGFDCIGVEAERRHAYFAETLRRAENRSFELIQGSIFEYRDRSEFDLVLALYIFHHFIKTRELHEAFIGLLRRLRMKAMVFGCHNKDQKAMQIAYRNYSPEAFVELILDHSNLTKARHIGTEAGRRELYLLEA